MAHKGKQVIWHKKKEKIIPSKFSKVSSPKIATNNPSINTGNKIKNFALNLKTQIKKAASEKG